MHGHDHPKLAKKLNDKIPKTVDEMFARVRAFIRGEVVVGSAEMVRPSQGDKGYVHPTWTGRPKRARNRGGPREARRNMRVYTPYPKKDIFTLLTKIPKEILAIESISFPEPPPLIGTPKKQNLNKWPTSDPMSLEKTWGRENTKEAFTISYEHPDQYVKMGTTLTTNCKQLLVDVLRENRERRPMASEGRLSLKEKVFHWLKEGLFIKVQYPEWIANTIPIKLASKTWKVQIDYSSLNKVCAKDMYPLPEVGEELASLMGYPYKCFLRLPKEYSQIRMAEGDEEKTGFHTEEGVYCFTHMLKELKKLRCYTSEDDGKGLSRSKRMKHGNILERNSNKKQK
ncbi:hypothetical protein Tco_1356391 [Tanacetum coccineum]